ncbi:MAG: adenosylcobinamide amidohydrolase [Deltaproteobacteria bacterium]|jgi:adenosylcobinamide amidohydrolase/ABC-type Fe3+-hydroxamate transport system substrate-binding protein|nr:adenosylcobinamide amidohydrolase [Deltaproteobacteria bacterium]
MRQEKSLLIFRKKIPVVLSLLSFLLLSLFSFPENLAFAADFQDDLGRVIKLSTRLKRVVSLSPGATESLCAVEAGASLMGITTADSYFPCLVGVPAVGPPDSPDWSRVKALKPDLLIVDSDDLGKAEAALGGQKVPIIAWSDSLEPEAAEERILRLGKLFGKNKEAAAAFEESQDYRNTIALKTSKIPQDKRLRVMRLRALPDGSLGTAAKDSYESALIAAAGGIPPALAGSGTVPLSPAEFQTFNPQFLYGCANDAEAINAVAKKSPWSRNPAMKNVHYYPCALTNLTSAHVGYFIAWLSSDLYPDEYGDPANFVTTDEIIKRTPVPIKDIPYLKDANILEYKLFDFPHRTLLINFKSPQNVVSSGDGAAWDNVSSVGNSGSPPMAWGIHHKDGWDTASNSVYQALGIDRDKSSLIFTGADLRALAVKSASYKEHHVTALATAGVDGNALRTSKDKGNWYQIGTINIILLSSHAISRTGAASAIIVATEAKTAALWDMDVRSAETPKVNPATGTGTDDIIVVLGGNGKPLDYTGGHSKIGELIATVVYEAVTEAIRLQNGKGKVRPVWLRLAERGIELHELGPTFANKGQMPAFEDEFYKLLLEPQAQALLEAAFALDDAHIMGEYSEVQSFQDFAQSQAVKLSGRGGLSIQNLVTDSSIPPALKSALNALGSVVLTKNGF